MESFRLDHVSRHRRKQYFLFRCLKCRSRVDEYVISSLIDAPLEVEVVSPLWIPVSIGA